MLVRVTVTIPEDVLARLDRIAEEKGVSRSDVVREAAAGYVTQLEAGRAAREREAAVEEGVGWLESLAARPPKDARPSIEILRELRGEDAALGGPIEPPDEERGG